MKTPARCPLHPVSVKLLRQGHPWVTLDGFSRRFPPDADLIMGLAQDQQVVGCLLHDPAHKTVKARWWSPVSSYQVESFWQDVEQRLRQAKDRRLGLASVQTRDHRYWIFAEADHLPGLMLLQLGQQFILQFYSFFWRKHLSALKPIIQKVFPDIQDTHLWVQMRSEDGTSQKLPTRWDGETSPLQFPVREMGMSIEAKLGESYDYGIYTDMAAIRFQLSEVFTASSRVLNLYSYTGAFSIFALTHGASEVISVDLSAKYLGWLDRNLKLNTFNGLHRALQLPCREALKLLRQQGQSFDLIIVDPPSFSSDGNKKTAALKAYEELWDDLQNLLLPQGQVMTFLNTHTVSAQKFEQHLKAFPMNRLRLKKRLTLQDDCPTLARFPEGNYLKGVIWQ